MVIEKELFLISQNKDFRKLLENRVIGNSFFISELQGLEELSKGQFLDLIRNPNVIIVIDESCIDDDIERILELAFSQRILILKDFFRDDEVYHFLRAGVRGITSLDDFYANAGNILSSIWQDEIYLASNAIEQLFLHIKSGINLGNLTNRERQVLPLIMNGSTYDQVAMELDVSHETIKSHVKNIYRKLKIKTKGDLLKYEFSNLDHT